MNFFGGREKGRGFVLDIGRIFFIYWKAFLINYVM